MRDAFNRTPSDGQLIEEIDETLRRTGWSRDDYAQFLALMRKAAATLGDTDWRLTLSFPRPGRQSFKVEIVFPEPFDP